VTTVNLDRLREIVRGPAARQPEPAPAIRELTYEPVGADGLPLEQRSIPAFEGTASRHTPFGAVAVIDRAYGADAYLGRVRVEHCELVHLDALDVLGGRRLAPRTDTRLGPVFLDIETTGLSGGVGTVPFLVGCGYFEGGAFRTIQFFMPDYGAERALLHAVADFLADAPFIVTYNGRSFDVPVMEMRWLFHRVPPPLDDLPHFDMLPPARRLWRHEEDGAERSCRLVTLAEALFGHVRVGDVPGFEIPQRYFDYVRYGDTAPLESVLEHNRLDLVALAAVTARAQRLVCEGSDAARDAGECLALGRLYRRAGRLEEAEAAFRRVARMTIAARPMREDAMHQLALLLRRQRRYEDAARVWQDLLAFGHGVSAAAREAIEALAIHHEHRARDLHRARELASRALQAEGDPRRREAVRHRLSRLDRKLGARRRPPAPRLLD
jgi:hypothetical protein